MTLFRAHGRVVQSILGSRELGTAGNWCPMSNLAALSRSLGLWHLDGDPGMIGCLECPLTRLVLAQSWCQTTTERP